MTRTDDGMVELRVAVPHEQKLAEVQGRAWVKKAIREFAPTAEQLRKAGMPVDERQLTLSHLKEVLVLDATTYRITSHRFEFGLLIPYPGGKPMAFEQKVEERNHGAYEGKIALPAGL